MNSLEGHTFEFISVYSYKSRCLLLPAILENIIATFIAQVPLASQLIVLKQLLDGLCRFRCFQVVLACLSSFPTLVTSDTLPCQNICICIDEAEISYTLNKYSVFGWSASICFTNTICFNFGCINFCKICEIPVSMVEEAGILFFSQMICLIYA